MVHQLHLQSTTVGTGRSGFTAPHLQSTIRFTPAFKAAMKRYSHVTVTIHSVITGQNGEKETKTGSLVLKRRSSSLG